MKAEFPFTDYDFWAFLTAGFLFLISADFIFGLNLVPKQDWNILDVIVVVGTSYILGHLFAGLSSLLLERTLVRRWIGDPTAYLLGKGKPPGYLQKLFSEHFHPLPSEVLFKVLAAATKAGFESERSIFLGAFLKSREIEIVQKRLSHFLNQYGMCRNLSLVLFFITLMLIARWISRGDLEAASLSPVVLLLSCAFFFRFLKYYRLYARETLLIFLKE